ncbi:hypothetical protein LACDD01_01615 [Lactococcus sp. DD01]|nr:hypothetical protein LACDD01_01615 [Lactococcus sp. DD01]
MKGHSTKKMKKYRAPPPKKNNKQKKASLLRQEVWLGKLSYSYYNIGQGEING